MRFIGELKRRNVFKMAIAWLVAAWLIVQLTPIPILPLLQWVGHFIVLLLAVLFIPTLIDNSVIEKIMSLVG